MVSDLHGVEGLGELAGDVAGTMIALDRGPRTRRKTAQGRGDRDAVAIHAAQQLVMPDVPGIDIEEGQQVVIPISDLHVADVGLPLLIGPRGRITATGANAFATRLPSTHEMGLSEDAIDGSRTDRDDVFIQHFPGQFAMPHLGVGQGVVDDAWRSAGSVAYIDEKAARACGVDDPSQLVLSQR